MQIKVNNILSCYFYCANSTAFKASSHIVFCPAQVFERSALGEVLRQGRRCWWYIVVGTSLAALLR